jgi:hypothetical protein
LSWAKLAAAKQVMRRAKIKTLRILPIFTPPLSSLAGQNCMSLWNVIHFI